MDLGHLQKSLPNVSRETFFVLQSYVELLHHWNQKINLIGECEAEEIWSRHVIDSAQLLNYVKDKSQPLIDLGSGAGLPGIILAILGCTNITLIESDMKKCQFLHEASRICKTPVKIIPERIENISEMRADVITARALASLDKLIEMSVPFCREDTYCLFPKGVNWSKELEAAKLTWNFQHEHFQSLTASDSMILKLYNIKRTNQDL